MLEEAIKNHGKPASIMTDHGSQFYANAPEAKRKGALDIEKRLVGLGIHRILAPSSASRSTASWRGCTERSSAIWPGLRQC